MEPWRRNLYVTVAMVFVVFLGFAFVLPFIPLYVRELGVEGEERVALWSGVIIGIAPLLAGLLAPVWGRWADRFGAKRMALRALVAYVVLLALSAFARTPLELLLLRVGIGLTGGIGPLGLAMATSLAPREQTGRAVGLVQSAQILSAAVGPFAGGLLADVIGIRRTFLVTALFCGVALAVIMWGYREPGSVAEARGHAEQMSFREVLTLPRVLPLLLVLFLVNFISRSFTPILPLHLERLGVAPERLAVSTGIVISVFSVMAALSSALLGGLSRRASPLLLLIASLLGGAATVLPMALAPSFGAFLALATLLGLASGGALTLCYTIGGLLVPGERRTTAFGFFSGAALFGGAISPSVAGLMTHVDLRAIYVVDAALYLLLAGALALQMRRERPRSAAPLG
jgi:DHA1 family multidrug resistance protein-like MFS transporter